MPMNPECCDKASGNYSLTCCNNFYINRGWNNSIGEKAVRTSSKMNFSQVINATGKNSVKKTVPLGIWWGGSRGGASMSFGR